MNWSDIGRKAKKAGKNAILTGGIASTTHSSAADLPKPLADQYRDYTAKVRIQDTGRDVRDRLQSGTRLNAQPTTTREIDKLRKQQRSR